eukprot:3206033-Rhodomonas_salina.1
MPRHSLRPEDSGYLVLVLLLTRRVCIVHLSCALAASVPRSECQCAHHVPVTDRDPGRGTKCIRVMNHQTSS